MFYNVIYKIWGNNHPFGNLFRYVSVRSICAFLISFLFILLIGNRFIYFLKNYQKNGQPIRDDGPQSHIEKKQGTPTMGGILIILSVLVGSFLFGDLQNANFWLCLLVFLGFGVIGAIDDYRKIKKRDYHGVSAKKKFLLQSVFAIVCCYIFITICDFQGITTLFFPIFKHYQIELGCFFIFWAGFIIVGSSNAVNLTDGLDGLAMGPVISSSICLAIIGYLAGNTVFSDYLHIQYVPGMAEVCIFLGALLGSSFGFMWFNSPPAKIFMGDTGSVAIGGVLGFIAVMSKQEFTYALIGGIFVLEAISVIVQVIYFKLTGKKIFLMAPIHHHFEKKGWAEPTVVFRCWIISFVLGILGLALLKVR
ncbi:MAG: phospho-N-acetylmuramoyl-pentapeptide-transferase [Holosporales bacterium]|jgi:phospho-N-acetylmuramoyl-pentapeptide-transferase|nr:phospho-N-acetylmuramoyl-pentapeptide-transferase [Holosporales bacterium]